MPPIEERFSSLRRQLTEATGGEGIKQLCLGLVDICQDLATRLADLEEAQEDLHLYVESIDEDLTRLEEHLYGPAEEDEDEEEAPFLNHAETKPSRSQ